jgi:biotin carboxylase
VLPASASVCVTCVGGRLIYDIIRGLRQADGLSTRVVGVDTNPEAHGRLLCDAFAIVPRAEDDPAGYIARIEVLHAQHRFDIFFPLSEGEARAAAQFADRLKRRGILSSVSSFATVLDLTDKLTLLQRSAGAGIEVGTFVAVDSEAEARAAAADLGYPHRKVVLKPRRSTGSRGVVILDANETEWRVLLPNRFCGTATIDSAFGAMRGAGLGFEQLIAVPHVDGPVYDVDCIAVGGKLRDVATRLRQLRNPLWPTSTGHKLDLHPAVIDMARKLCAAFDVNGAADFDIALDSNGTPVLFDGAARFSGSVGGSLAAGANFPGQLLRVLMGLPHRPLLVQDGVVLRPYLTMSTIPPANEADYL